MNNTARQASLEVFEDMRKNGIDRLRAISYWNDDEGHLEEDIEVWEAGALGPSTWDIDDIEGLRDMLWEIDEYGIFEFDAVEHTISQVGEAWIPEPELEKKLYDVPQNVVAIDLESPTLPLVEYSNTGPFDDPLADLWTLLSQVPVTIGLYRNVVIDAQFMGWQKGTKVDIIVEWFKQATNGDRGRFSAKYNK